jgi:hypothetical protein
MLSKIRESVPPERCPFGSRPGLLRQGVLELVALTGFALCSALRRFCANFLNLSNFLLYVNHLFSSLLYRIEGLSNSKLRVIPRCDEPKSVDLSPVRISSFAQRKTFKQRPASLGPLRARGSFSPGSCNGLFSVGFPTGVRGLIPTSPDPSNQLCFLLPTSGGAQRPPGSSIAHQQLSKSSTSYLRLQLAVGFRSTISLRLVENSNHIALMQAQHLWETPSSCGKLKRSGVYW